MGIPVADEHAGYLEALAAELRSHGVRAHVDAQAPALPDPQVRALVARIRQKIRQKNQA